MKMQKAVIFANKCLKDKKYHKTRDHCHYTDKYRGPAHSICNLKYSVTKKNPIVFDNRSKWDYNFIVKALAEELQFSCLGKSTERYITFTVPIEKEVIRIDKNGE